MSSLIELTPALLRNKQKDSKDSFQERMWCVAVHVDCGRQVGGVSPKDSCEAIHVGADAAVIPYMTSSNQEVI